MSLSNYKAIPGDMTFLLLEAVRLLLINLMSQTPSTFGIDDPILSPFCQVQDRFSASHLNRYYEHNLTMDQTKDGHSGQSLPRLQTNILTPIPSPTPVVKKCDDNTKLWVYWRPHFPRMRQYIKMSRLVHHRIWL